ncbi:MAG: SurA N-terminal domain-containing protein [Gammaproteobacteria bacterium]|nr:SurA N-terminal domain-containing protein [Gammaproteobacteria bacterium]NNF60717.1 hypothetical protein [Gammaproteobacteria bacterium]NNM20659.1 hypothetical protein [Gammaproteobacteria bacterium]
MLQAIRDHLTGWVSIILFIVIGLAFALWGVPNEITGQNAVAQVNGEEIPLEEVRRAYRAQLNQFQQFSDVSPETQDLIRNQVLQGVVVDEVLAQHTRDAGYHIGNDALVAHIRNMEAFQDQGQFSVDLFKTRLSLQGINPQYFEAQMRRGLRITQVRRGIAETAFVTREELEARTRLERQQRVAEWLQLSIDPQSQDIVISDEQIEAHYSAAQDGYMQPESVDIEYVTIELADLAADVAVTEDDLQDYYRNEVDNGRFQAPEEREARHILIAVDDDTDDAAASQKAGEVLARLEAGEDFAALAAELSDDPGSAPEGGSLGWAQRSAYVGAFADTLFSMQPGELRGPVRTEFGYHVIRMDGQRGGVAKSFEEVRDELDVELRRVLAEDQFYDTAERIADLGFENPDTLEPVAAEMGFTIRQLDGLTRRGGDGLAANAAVIDAAFSERVLEQGENSDLLEISAESRMILRVAAHRPAQLRPLEEVRDAIVAELRQAAATELAEERGNALLARAQAGEALESLAAEAGVELKARESYRRTAALPAALSEALFRAPRPSEGGVTHEGVVLDDGSYALFALHEVVPGNTDNLGSPDTVANQYGIGDLTAYVTTLRDQASVQLRPELLE